MFATTQWVKDLVKKCFKQYDIYSTTERKIGKWIDGKPIYRKIVSVKFAENIPDEFVKLYDNTFSDLNIPIQTCISCIFVQYGTSRVSWGNENGNEYFASVNATTTGIRTNANRSTYSGITRDVIIEYTKTTD